MSCCLEGQQGSELSTGPLPAGFPYMRCGGGMKGSAPPRAAGVHPRDHGRSAHTAPSPACPWDRRRAAFTSSKKVDIHPDFGCFVPISPAPSSLTPV